MCAPNADKPSPYLIRREILQEIIVAERLLDDLLGPEVLFKLLYGHGLGGVDAPARHALLLGQGVLPGHAVVLLDGGQEVVVPSGHEAGGLLEDAL